MWAYISAILLIALVCVLVHYERREKMSEENLRASKAAMLHVLAEQGLSDAETPVPGQGKML